MTAEDTASEASATEPSDQTEIDLTPAPPATKVLPTTMAPTAAFEDANEANDEKMRAPKLRAFDPEEADRQKQSWTWQESNPKPPSGHVL